MGVSVRAAMVETELMMATIHPNCLKISGHSAHHGKGDENGQQGKCGSYDGNGDLVGRINCRRFGLCSPSICVVMFSNATMASSTTIPMAMLRDDSEMMLSVLPDMSRYMKDATRDTGITMATMSVERQRPRKNNTMKTTRIRVTMIVWIRLR